MRARLDAIATTLDADDPINIQFTSGTTGNPKGATLTHCNILNNRYEAGKGMRLTPECISSIVTYPEMSSLT